MRSGGRAELLLLDKVRGMKYNNYELVWMVRRETHFEGWLLQARERESLLTQGEKQQLDKGIRAIVGLLKGSVTTLIEAAAKGTGEALVKGR